MTRSNSTCVTRAAVRALAILTMLCATPPQASSGTTTAAAMLPECAYPVNPPLDVFDAKLDRVVPGSKLTFTRAQVEDNFTPPDWHPEDHPAMPDVVAHGRKPMLMACMKCHLTNGAGHPESSDLAGLSASYIQKQMLDFKNGNRHGARASSMLPIAREVTAQEAAQAAQYFSALPPMSPGWHKVVETDTVPKTQLRTGGMRFVVANGGSEPIGSRIIELPQDPELAELRDSRSGFIANVPKRSLARGAALVTTGAGKTQPCSECHGPDLEGHGEVPRIIARSPLYVFRQLNDVKIGTRGGPDVVLMQTVVANLNQEDMLAIAAYLASREL